MNISGTRRASVRVAVECVWENCRGRPAGNLSNAHDLGKDSGSTPMCLVLDNRPKQNGDGFFFRRARVVVGCNNSRAADRV